MGNNSYQTIDDGSLYGSLSLPKIVADPKDNLFKPLSLNYNPDTNIYSSTYDNNNWEINLSKYFNNNLSSKSLIFSASTGLYTNKQQLRINSIKIRVPIPVIQKVDIDNYDKKLEGAKFDIYDANYNKILQDYISDENGQIYLPTNLKSGNYFVLETEAPVGYIQNEEYQPFTVDNNKEYDYITLPSTSKISQ